MKGLTVKLDVELLRGVKQKAVAEVAWDGWPRWWLKLGSPYRKWCCIGEWKAESGFCNEYVFMFLESNHDGADQRELGIGLRLDDCKEVSRF